MNHRLQSRTGSVGFLCLALALASEFAPGASAQTVTITNVSVPGAATLWISALNQAGQVAGVYTMPAGMSRTFLWSPTSLYDVGSLGGGSAEASTLNNGGMIVGQSSTTVPGELHAFVFNAGVMSDVGPAGIPVSSGIAINDAGQVAGYFINGTLQHAYVASGGILTDLGTLGGSFSSPVGINSSGQVAGDSTDSSGRRRAFRFSSGVMADLGTLGGTVSFSSALNNAGQVTGMASTSDGSLHAFVHNGAGMFDLGTLGGSFSIGYSINQSGHVSGDSMVTGDIESHAFLHNGAMQDLGTLGGTFSTPLGLNNLDQVVGVAADGSEADRAFLWQNGALIDLNTLLPVASGWFLDAAYYINDNGQIVGTGTYNGASAWFLMSVTARSNQAPVAVAGPAQTIDCAGFSTAVLLDGTGSSDPDGDTLSYEWRHGSTVLATTPTVAVAVALGVATFTLRVTDSHGAVAEDTVAITFVDHQPPVVRCPANDTARANERGQAEVPNFLFAASIADACTPDVLLHKVQTPPVGSLVGIGTTVVVLSVTDSSGNSNSCTVTFTVEGVPPDTTLPVVECPRAVTLSAGSDGQAAVPNLLEGLVASDNVTPAGALVKTQSPAAGTRVGLGTYAVTVTVTDAAGNSAVCATALTVVDTTAPTISSVSSSVLNLQPLNHQMVPVTLTVNATDNCDSSVVSRIVSVTSNEAVTGNGNRGSDWEVTGPLTVSLRAENEAKQSPRIYSITVDCSDAAGNHSTATVHVTASKTDAGAGKKK